MDLHKFYKNEMTYAEVMRLRSITLVCGKEVRHFGSMRQLFKAYRKLMTGRSKWYVEVILADGKPFMLNDFYHAFMIFNHQLEQHVYREGSVPGVYKRKASSRSCFRRIKTTGERKQWGEVEDANEWLSENYSVMVKTRRARSIRSLPNSFDDIMASKNQRNWKAQRKTQWK